MTTHDNSTSVASSIASNQGADRRRGRAPLSAAAIFAAAVASADAMAQIVSNPVLVPNHVILNEVVVGTLEYIELYNPTNVAKPVNGLVLKTSYGVFGLGDVMNTLAPRQHLLLLRGRPEEARTSSDPAVMIKIVGAPILGAMGDTVVLETRTGTVLDAMSYGVTADTSALYRRAVTANQFPNGQFVDIGQEFTEVMIGRRGNSGDSNNLTADWALHGGANSYVATPLGRNNEVVGGDVYSIKAVQSRVNELFLNTYFANVTTASCSGYAGTDASSTATHAFAIDSSEFGNVLFTGPVSWNFQGGANGDYTIHYQGSMQSFPAAYQLDIDVAESRVGGNSTITLDADLFDVGPGGTHRPYHEVVTLGRTGVRGSYSIAQSRTLVDWFGVPRSTSVDQTIQWNVVGGQLASSASGVRIVRDYPTLPNRVWSGPNPVFTTETLTYSSLAQATSTGAEVVFPSYQSDFGGYGVADHQNARIDFVADLSNRRISVVRTADITYPDANGWLTRMNITANATQEPATGNIAIDGHLLESGNEYFTFTGFIDPPAGVRKWPTWGEVWEGTKTAGKWVGHAAATIVTGGVCAVATTATAGTMGITTLATLGTATPVAVGTTAAVGGACVYVSNIVFEATHP